MTRSSRCIYIQQIKYLLYIGIHNNQENNDRGLGINEISISSVVAPTNNALLNKSNKSNITLANSDSLFLHKSPVSLNKNTDNLSDSTLCGPESNVANTAAKTIPCNDVQFDNSQVNNISPRNNGIKIIQVQRLLKSHLLNKSHETLTMIAVTNLKL